MHAPILEKKFPAKQNENLNLVNRAYGSQSLNAKCNKIFVFNLQTEPDRARKLSRANRIRRILADKAKVRTVLIAQEVLRIKCAKLWGMINPTNLLIKSHTLHNSNFGERDEASVSSTKEYSTRGDCTKCLPTSCPFTRRNLHSTLTSSNFLLFPLRKLPA